MLLRFHAASRRHSDETSKHQGGYNREVRSRHSYSPGSTRVLNLGGSREEFGRASDRSLSPSSRNTCISDLEPSALPLIRHVRIRRSPANQVPCERSPERSHNPQRRAKVQGAPNHSPQEAAFVPRR